MKQEETLFWQPSDSAHADYDTNVQTHQTLPLPIGITDYRVASSEYYYVDKTLLIKDILDERAHVSLFTRPRRFGKTLNMDMLRMFFEKTEEDTSVYFQDKKIWKCGEKYRKHQGLYPVIFITLKDVKCESWAEIYGKFVDVIRSEYSRHSELSDSALCNELDRQYYCNILKGRVTSYEMENASWFFPGCCTVILA